MTGAVPTPGRRLGGDRPPPVGVGSPRGGLVRRTAVIGSVVAGLAAAWLATTQVAARPYFRDEPDGLAALWTTRLPAPPAARPAHDGGRVYLLLRNSSLAAVDTTSGALLWSVEVTALPAVAAGEGLVFLAASAAIEARSGGDGSLQWRVSIDGDVTGSLLWDQGWLLAVTRRGTVIAIRARDGQTIWSKPAGAAASVAPALAADRAYLALADGRVQARQLLTGDLLWERALGGVPSELLPLDDRIFVGAADRFFYCLAVKDGAIKWRWRAGGAIVGAPVVDAESVYFVSLDNVLRALNRKNGHQRWRQLLATRPSGGPLRFERDMLAVAGIEAEVRAYRAKDGSLAASVATPAELASPLCVVAADQRHLAALIAVTLEGQLLAVSLAPIGHAIEGLPLFLPLPSGPGPPTPPA